MLLQRGGLLLNCVTRLTCLVPDFDDLFHVSHLVSHLFDVLAAPVDFISPRFVYYQLSYTFSYH